MIGEREFGRLDLRQDGAGLRHYLHGRPVPAGAVLELQAVRRVPTDDGADLVPAADWVTVRYEARLAVNNPDDVRVTLHGRIAGYDATLPGFLDEMRFRWPR